MIIQLIQVFDNVFLYSSWHEYHYVEVHRAWLLTYVFAIQAASSCPALVALLCGVVAFVWLSLTDLPCRRDPNVYDWIVNLKIRRLSLTIETILAISFTRWFNALSLPLSRNRSKSTIKMRVVPMWAIQPIWYSWINDCAFVCIVWFGVDMVFVIWVKNALSFKR